MCEVIDLQPLRAYIKIMETASQQQTPQENPQFQREVIQSYWEKERLEWLGARGLGERKEHMKKLDDLMDAHNDLGLA